MGAFFVFQCFSSTTKAEGNRCSPSSKRGTTAFKKSVNLKLYKMKQKKKKEEVLFSVGTAVGGGYSSLHCSSFLVSSCGTSNTLAMWHPAILVETEEVGESIEMTYRQSPMFSYSTFGQSQPPDRVCKIVFSCKDGKWHKSEPVYGKIIAAQSEYFEFEN